MEIYHFNNAVNLRYQTLIKNIKNNSNSFYDSFLDLLEETIKYILDTNNITYDSTKTCGGILKEVDVSSFLIEKLKLDEYTYNKLPDYIKKCNDHKHKKEKTLSIESIVNYLRVYYNLINYYYSYINIKNIDFDEEYYISIFKETEKNNEILKKEVTLLKKELDEAYNNKQLNEQAYLQYEQLLSIAELEKLDLEEQNTYLQTQIKLLNSIKESVNITKRLEKIEKQNQDILNSLNKNDNKVKKKQEEDEEVNKFFYEAKKQYIWNGKLVELENLKQKLKTSSIVILLVGISITILEIIATKYYSTFSLFENIWMVFVFITLIKNNNMTKVISDKYLKSISSFMFELNEFYFYEITVEKNSYKVFKILSIISSVLSILYYIFYYKESTIIAIIIILLEIIFIINVFIFASAKNNIQYGYMTYVKIMGKKINSNEKVTLIYNNRFKKFYPKDEYYKKHGNLEEN